MARFRPGTRVKYSNGVIYRVAPDGSHRREDGGGLSKAARKAAKRVKVRQRKQKHKVHRLETCATGAGI